MATPTPKQREAIEYLLTLEDETILRQVAYRAMDLLTEQNARDQGPTFVDQDGRRLDEWHVTSGLHVPVGAEVSAEDAERYEVKADLAGMTGYGAMLLVIHRDDNELPTGDLDEDVVRAYWDGAVGSWHRAADASPLENTRTWLGVVAQQCDEQLQETEYELEQAAMGFEPEASSYDIEHCPIGEPPTPEQLAEARAEQEREEARRREYAAR